MNDLVIKLTGEVLSSNFEQWKDALVAQIRSTRTELSTDNDFVEAGWVGHLLISRGQRGLSGADFGLGLLGGPVARLPPPHLHPLRLVHCHIAPYVR